MDYGTMKVTWRLLVPVTVAVALVAGALGAGGEARGRSDELALALDAYNRATIHSDTAALAALVTDDYMLVNSDSSVQDKRSYLADFAVPGFKLDPYRIERPIRKVEGDAALTGGTFQLGWIQDGRHHSRTLRIAHFWIRRHDRWQIAYTQLTRVPE